MRLTLSVTWRFNVESVDRSKDLVSVYSRPIDIVDIEVGRQIATSGVPKTARQETEYFRGLSTWSTVLTKFIGQNASLHQ
jgi:hypothetical protein